MRTKALILSVAFGAMGIATSMAQVFSENVVGYYNLDLLPGFNLVANQFDNGGNTVNEVLPTVADGTEILTWNTTSQSFNTAHIFVSDLGGWVNGDDGSPSDIVISLGTGFFINTLSPASVTMVGEVPEGTLTLAIPPLFSIVAQMTPQSLALNSAGDELPAVDGDELLFFDSTTQAFNTANVFVTDLGGWVDGNTGEPVTVQPAVGQAFFYNHIGATTISWTRVFQVN